MPVLRRGAAGACGADAVEVRVAQRHREGVRGVARLRRRPSRPSSRATIIATCDLLRAAEAGDLHLDRGRRERAHRHPGRRPRQEHRAAHVAEDERAAGVHGVEEVLHGEGVGMDAGDDLGDPAMDEVQPLGEAQGGRGREHALLDQHVAAAVRLDDPVARAQGSRIDAEDDHAAR